MKAAEASESRRGHGGKTINQSAKAAEASESRRCRPMPARMTAGSLRPEPDGGGPGARRPGGTDESDGPGANTSGGLSCPTAEGGGGNDEGGGGGGGVLAAGSKGVPEAAGKFSSIAMLQDNLKALTVHLRVGTGGGSKESGDDSSSSVEVVGLEPTLKPRCAQPPRKPRCAQPPRGGVVALPGDESDSDVSIREVLDGQGPMAAESSSSVEFGGAAALSSASGGGNAPGGAQGTVFPLPSENGYIGLW